MVFSFVRTLEFKYFHRNLCGKYFCMVQCLSFKMFFKYFFLKLFFLPDFALFMGKKKESRSSQKCVLVIDYCLMMNMHWNRQMYVVRGGRGCRRTQGHAPCYGPQPVKYFLLQGGFSPNEKSRNQISKAKKG